MRTFLAVTLDEEIRRSLAEIARSLGPHLKKAVKWVEPENIHLTVKFLGDVQDAKVHEVSAAIASQLVGVPSFSFGVKGVGFFPERSAPRVLWVGIDKDHSHLETIYGRLNRSLVRFGVKQEQRPFSPHITLGRVREKLNLSREQVLELLEPYASHDYGLQEVASIDLMMSELHSRGPIYTKVASFPLSG